jgi:abhydrolase domain-containing protein 2
MVSNLTKKYPHTKIISLGFSLGGNLITKYLGENHPKQPRNIIGGISVCQGYDANT